MLKICFYAFTVIVIMHTLACLLWFTLKSNNIYVTPTDFGAIRSRLGDPYKMTGDEYRDYFAIHEQFRVFVFQLLSMWYHAALVMGLVDITARTKLQLVSLIMMYVLMAVVNAIIFGLLFDLIGEVSKKTTSSKKKSITSTLPWPISSSTPKSKRRCAPTFSPRRRPSTSRTS